MADTPATPDRSRAGLADAVARRRVSLGFLTAVAVVVFAQPAWTAWQVGLAVAAAGEAIRIWAAGHLEKGREVTRSGPYQWTGHPLYFGSSLIALGVALACRSVVVAAVIVVYMAATLTAAVRSEEAFLSRTFGDAYDRYRRSASGPGTRRFSWARARKNREYRAVLGLAAGFALLALRIVLHL
jgi:protein-S-isoprenylcysteine O-methyltransferase Ste14